MSAVLKTVSWQDVPFKSPHESVDVNRYMVSSALQYVGRWLEEKGMQKVSVSVMPDGLFLYVISEGQSLVCCSRSEVASALNAVWLSHLTRLGQGSAKPHADEMIDPTLMSTRTDLEACDEELFQVAMTSGQANHWISRSWDPPFTRKSFAKVRSLAALEWVFSHGNWSLGTGFIYQDLAFVNQIDGGDEWLVIRKDIGDFESWSAGHALRDDPTAVQTFVEDCLAATGQQLRSLDYYGARLKP